VDSKVFISHMGSQQQSQQAELGNHHHQTHRKYTTKDGTTTGGATKVVCHIQEGRLCNWDIQLTVRENGPTQRQ